MLSEYFEHGVLNRVARVLRKTSRVLTLICWSESVALLSWKRNDTKQESDTLAISIKLSLSFFVQEKLYRIPKCWVGLKNKYYVAANCQVADVLIFQDGQVYRDVPINPDISKNWDVPHLITVNKRNEQCN